MNISLNKAALTSRMWWRFLVAFVPCLLLLVLLDVYIYKQEMAHYVALTEQNEQLKIQNLKVDVFLEIENFSRTLVFLSTYLKKQIIQHKQVSSAILSPLIQQVVDSHPYIDYIGFIEHENSHEHRYCHASRCPPMLVTAHTIPTLLKNQVFISDIHLKRSSGEIQVPLTPVMQLAIPVFNADDLPQGVLVLSHINRQLYRHLDWANKDSQSQTMLLNANAYWLYHPEKKYEWGSDLRERRNLRLSNQNPQLWQRLQEEKNGQFYDHQHLYTFQTLYPRQDMNHSPMLSSYIKEGQPLTWMIVTRYPHQAMQQLLNKKTYIHLPLLLAIILMLVFILWSYTTECLRKTRIQLKHNTHNLKQTQALSHMGSWSWSEQKLQCSEQAYQIFGVASGVSSLNFKTFLNLVHPDDKKEVKLKLLECMNEKIDYDLIHRIIRMDNAQVCTVHAKAYVSVDDQQRARMIGVVQDISAQLHDKERIRFLAQQDILTHVPNRTLFMDRLGQNILYSQREKSQFTILYIRINDFKGINQRIGHNKADMILREVAQRLLHTVRRSDTVARISGHVFAILLRHTFEYDDLMRVCNNLRAILHAPIFVQQEKHTIKIAVGIACFPTDGQDIDMLNIRVSQALDATTEQQPDMFYANIPLENDSVA